MKRTVKFLSTIILLLMIVTATTSYFVYSGNRTVETEGFLIVMLYLTFVACLGTSAAQSLVMERSGGDDDSIRCD